MYWRALILIMSLRYVWAEKSSSWEKKVEFEHLSAEFNTHANNNNKWKYHEIERDKIPKQGFI